MKRKRTAIVPLRDPERIYAQVLVAASDRALEILGEDPLIRKLPGLVRSRSWVDVIRLTESLETQQYSSVLDQYVKTQLVALVKRYPFTRDEAPGYNPEAAAWKKFQKAEHRCKRVNQRSAVLRNGDGFRHWEFFPVMREFIRNVLGRKPNYTRIYDLCNYCPGASVGVSGGRTNLGRKFSAKKWSVTRLALPTVTAALWQQDQLRHLILGPEEIVCLDYEEFAARVKARCDVVTHNNISFVPKTFKTFRSIASEPLLNGYLQKGIDEYIRERLLTVGLDLTDQHTNAEMARLGSLGGFNPYVTIDLSSASDSIASSVVKLLLPSEWYSLLNCARSHWYKYKGVKHPYHKFVSMGNGFCFPLQTLIFASIAHASCVLNRAPVDFRVYGDDIIVRQSEALQCLDVLKHLGFRSNPDKTFLTGPFRESCGADWYNGLDIRPAYLDYRFTTNVDLYKFHNSTLASDLTYGFFEPIRELLLKACPTEVRFVRPFHGNPDAAFTVSLDRAMSSQSMHWDRKTFAWKWKEVRTTPIRDHLESVDPVLCNRLEYLAVLGGSSSRVPLAVRRKTQASVRRVSYWGPPGEGPWKDAAPNRGESPY